MSLSLLFTTTPISTFPTNPFFQFKCPRPGPNAAKLDPCCTCSVRDEPPQHKPAAPDKRLLSLHRRNVLLGLGGMYGATLGSSNKVDAKPVAPPDLRDCGPADLPAGATPTNCCPPYAVKIIDFKKPSIFSPMRRRQPAHLLDDGYIEKYNRAVFLMKQLDRSDPRSFAQQANVHCAYCDGAYDQVGFPVEIQIHNSWLFFPWHRYYVYFHERILGKLIGDDSFALPYWNWDSPDGMSIPNMYVNQPALYDQLRDAKHQPPALVDFDYNLLDSNLTSDQLITNNLTIMYRQVVSNAKTAELFLGAPYRAGDDPNPGAGSVETVPHNPVHGWVGDRTQPNLEDMGTFYSAARDPIFFAHHANVDRMWTLWKGLGGKNRKDFNDPDWLNAGFLFYDEDARLVRVKVADCLDTRKLRYVYEETSIPWLTARPKGSRKKHKSSKTANQFGPDPRTLTSTIRAKVKRPKWSRTRKEKEEEEEILIMDGIEIRRDMFVKFDIYVNVDGEDDENLGGPGSHEFCGAFINVPHNHSKMDGDGKPLKMKTSLRLGITDLLEDIEADGDEEIVVSIIPRAGNGEDIVIGAIKIEFGS
ncbi:polyphenol oxidase, chloroplastic-like [Magnolia sinica]|uniref:polyphenol oxidase, chloroplastic-like n=1 Tax=Magnolia sinica TaxID=86752 RepID=UPI00265875B2|nr:polyphenol oxidase, chloroplastic-like [Magnolia sinica]